MLMVVGYFQSSGLEWDAFDDIANYLNVTQLSGSKCV